MTFSCCKRLTNWLGRYSAGPVHHRTEELVKDVKSKGILGCNDYETINFKFLKKISKKSSRIITKGIKPLCFAKIDFQLSRDLLSRIPLPKTLESKEAMLLDFQGNLPLCRRAPIRTFRKQSKHSRRPAEINHHLLSEFKRQNEVPRRWAGTHYYICWYIALFWKLTQTTDLEMLCCRQEWS